MKIDIHLHTRKCKSGDAPTREISPPDFCKALLATDVGIAAITNHNVFDLEQFRQIKRDLHDEAQVWPGIELDVIDGGNRGHLLVIVSPSRADKFADAVASLTSGSTPDTFTATVPQVLQSFDSLGPLYVAHYRQKKPNLSEDALAKLLGGTKHPQRVIKEVTNSISAGIYISHGHASIYGSDVHNWADYASLSRNLPELRLPVDSFEQFCLLLEKDATTINTALNRKTVEELELDPFEDGKRLRLRVYNDINVLFGAKGTGKSCILKAVAKHYSKNGVAAKVYESDSDQLDELFDTSGKDLTINLTIYGIEYCLNDIECLRKAREADITSVSKYVAFFTSTSTNRNARRILLKDLESEKEGPPRRGFHNILEVATRTAEYLRYIKESNAAGEVLEPDARDELVRLLSGLVETLRAKAWTSFVAWQEVKLLNSAITCFRKEVERKTGRPAKPATTGLANYATNRIRIAACSAAIVKSFDTAISPQVETVGTLGTNKGPLELRTEFVFQNGTVTDGELDSLSAVRKSTQKKFAALVRRVGEHAYDDDLFQFVASLNDIEDVEGIKTVYELMLFRRYFALNGTPYRPSSGEASMVMLQKELQRDADIYLLDEPERSLGNEYISDVVVPLIKERARAGKKVFVSTHDANIAVRTLPYSSVYREHGQDGYKTYVGNPFTNKLTCSDDDTDQLDWRAVSMKTLEGGAAAFGERGKIYGQD